MAATRFYKWPILTTQTHTICRGALRFATQISPLLNLIMVSLHLYCSQVSDPLLNFGLCSSMFRRKFFSCFFFLVSAFLDRKLPDLWLKQATFWEKKSMKKKQHKPLKKCNITGTKKVITLIKTV